MMESRKRGFDRSLFDQKAFAIPVCSGLSGLGKTRLLDEWRTYFALSGIDGACLGVLVMYANGQGVLQDYNEAVKWYTLAAEQGVANAQHNLGVIYHEGHRVRQDYTEAR